MLTILTGILLAIPVAFSDASSASKSEPLTFTNYSYADKNQFPYVASIQLKTELDGNYSHSCAGAIIAPSWILTSGSCLGYYNSSHFRVVAGVLRVDDETGVEQILDIEDIVYHPSYVFPYASAYDIALLRLNDSLEYNDDNVKSILLPARDEVFTGTAAIAGWGMLTYDGGWPNRLKYARDVPIVPAEQCYEDIQRDTDFDLDRNICTDNGRGHMAACGMEPGAPLIYSDETVIGVVSWSWNDCIVNDAPSIYTRVATFADWIREEISQ